MRKFYFSITLSVLAGLAMLPSGILAQEDSVTYWVPETELSPKPLPEATIRELHSELKSLREHFVEQRSEQENLLKRIQQSEKQASTVFSNLLTRLDQLELPSKG